VNNVISIWISYNGDKLRSEFLKKNSAARVINQSAIPTVRTHKLPSLSRDLVESGNGLSIIKILIFASSGKDSILLLS